MCTAVLVDMWLKHLPFEVHAPCTGMVMENLSPNTPKGWLPRVGESYSPVLGTSFFFGSRRVWTTSEEMASPGLLPFLLNPVAYFRALNSANKIFMWDGTTLQYENGFRYGNDYERHVRSVPWQPYQIDKDIPEYPDGPFESLTFPDAHGRPCVMLAWTGEPVANAFWGCIRLPDDYTPRSEQLLVPAVTPEVLIQITVSDRVLFEALRDIERIFRASDINSQQPLFNYPLSKVLLEQPCSSITWTSFSGVGETSSSYFFPALHVAYRSFFKPNALTFVSLAALPNKLIADAGLEPFVVPKLILGESGFGLPPTTQMRAPLFFQHGTRTVLASSEQACREQRHVEVLDGYDAYFVVSPGLAQAMHYDSPWNEELRLGGIVRRFDDGPLLGQWLIIEPVGHEGTMPPFLVPEQPCEPTLDVWEKITLPPSLDEPATLEGLDQLQEFMATKHWGSSDWLYKALPSSLYRFASLLTGTKERDDLVKGWSREIFSRDTYGPGAYRDIYRGWRVPFPTQTAWHILATAELYRGLQGEEAKTFRDAMRQGVIDAGDFLVRWKRGADAAPLIALEEMATPEDVYPTLVVYLGLTQAARLLYQSDADYPAIWQDRLAELQIEVAAQLLQDGACLTCPETMRELATALGTFSHQVYQALDALPTCSRENASDLLPCASYD